MDEKYRLLLAQALENAAYAAFMADRTGRFVWTNEAFCRLSGYAQGELIHQTPRLLRSGRQNLIFYQKLWQTILAGAPWQGELIERNKAGQLYTVSQIITPLGDAAGNITHFMTIQQDITLASHERDAMRQMAYYDSLTGLPNRARFLELFTHELAIARAESTQLALMFLDLDGFKAVNDRLGHAAGDKLLNAVAERLVGAVRKSDIVARMSGDEFTILLTHLEQTGVVEMLAQHLVASIDGPFAIDGQRVNIHVSLGIAFFPTHGLSTDALLSHSDAAMYKAKAQGGAQYCVADPLVP